MPRVCVLDCLLGGVLVRRRAAMHEIEELTIRGDRRSSAETEYYRVLCALAADYERRLGADRWHTLTPVVALRELMAPKTEGEELAAPQPSSDRYRDDRLQFCPLRGSQ